MTGRDTQDLLIDVWKKLNHQKSATAGGTQMTVKPVIGESPLFNLIRRRKLKHANNFNNFMKSDVSILRESLITDYLPETGFLVEI